MTVQHSVLDGADLHEPKGITTAVARAVYVANGASSGTWQYLPFAFFSYANAAFTVTTPTDFTVVLGPVVENGTLASYGIDKGVGFRATITTDRTQIYRISWSLSISQNGGAGVDIYATISKNGSPLTQFQAIATTDSGDFTTLAGYVLLSLAMDDYIEIVVKTASGDLSVYHPTLSLVGLPS